jgi:hypothetical protein
MAIAKSRALLALAWLFVSVLSKSAYADDHTSWPADILNWGIAPWRIAPVDLSFLNAPEKPAGKHGFLHVVKDKLVFEDGTVARFWGTNLTAAALFGSNSRDDVRVQARRLSQLGFNLVRFHHHDSFWVKPNIFGNGSAPNTKTLSQAMLEKLDWWIKCLKDEGIYIWLDLEVQRKLKRGDGITNFDEVVKNKPGDGLKGFNYINASIQQAMKRFNEAYLGHLNRFTGLRYKDDPAIAVVLINNENDITHHYAIRFLPDKNVPRHTAIYMAAAKAFAEKYGLPKDKVWRSWEQGPSKLFLNDLEHRFNVDMIAHLRAIGVKVPIVTTSSWGKTLLSSLPALTSGDLIDVHAYSGTKALDSSPVKSGTLMQWTAASRVLGYPFSVSEWNETHFPAPDRHSLPLNYASAACWQGWDALMQYAYAQQPVVGPGRPSNWQLFNDPGLLATMPAAALLYRRHDVREAKTVYVFAPTKDQFYNRSLGPGTSVALRTAAERGRLYIAIPQTKELPWLAHKEIPAGAKVFTDPDQSLIDRNAKESISDTGELHHNWETGIFTINTPRSQAAMGRIGGRTIKLADVDIEVSTPNATVAVQSLDRKSLPEAGAILISLGAQSIPESKGKAVFYSEPVIGRLTIRARKGLKLYPQRERADQPAIAAPYSEGRYHIALDRNLHTYWLLLK